MKKMAKSLARELHRNKYIFHTISKSSKKRRAEILNNAPLSLFKNIKTLCKCLVDGRIPLTNVHRRRLRPHVSLIREISAMPVTGIKDNVVMRGDGIGSFKKSLLPIIAPILTALI